MDSAAVGELLCWREYEEHVERLLELGIGAAESTPFEEEGGLETQVAHAWRVIGFSVRRVPCEPSAPHFNVHIIHTIIVCT